MCAVDSSGARPRHRSLETATLTPTRPRGTRARRLAALAAILTACLAGPAAASATPPGAVASWGREAVRADTKTACIYTRNDLRLLRGFQRRVGRSFSCALVFNDAAPGWRGWIEPWVIVHPDPRFRWDEWVAATPGRRLVVTQALIPASVPADWRRRGARGEYDRYARALARRMVSAGLGDSIIRLGHEMNGT